MTEAVYEGEYSGPDLELASQGRRLATHILDAIFFVITLGIGWLIWFLIVGGRGQTPAKQILGMHVVRGDGNRARLGWMLLREIVLKWAAFVVLDQVLSLADEGIGGLVTLAVFIVAALWCIWDANRQCLWDKVVGTYVVREAEGPGRMVATTRADRAAENLETLEDLHSRGLLTDEEYAERRARELERL